MNLLTLALRNLGRRPLRTALTIVAIGLAVGSTLALVALSYSIRKSADEGLNELGADLTVTQRGASDLFGGFLPEQIGQQLSTIPGVTGVTGELWMFAPDERDRHVLVAGRGRASMSSKHLPLREGRLPQDGERRIALVGDVLADAMGKHLDDSLEILGERFRIVGITKYASAMNRNLVIVPLPDLQEAAYRKGQVTLFEVSIRRGASGAEIERIKDDIGRIGRLVASMSSEILQGDRNYETLNALSRIIAVIALTMGAVNILNTLMMTTQERIREIGIVSAIGWSSPLIMTAIVIEGLAMCAIGCALGIALGYAASFLFAAVPTVGDYIEFKPTLGLIAPTVVATFALCAIGSLYPAWRAVRITPAEALRRA
ncbi:MAG: ABC transporter permease [Xanthobacteraceae bacterium]